MKLFLLILIAIPGTMSGMVKIHHSCENQNKGDDNFFENNWSLASTYYQRALTELEVGSTEYYASLWWLAFMYYTGGNGIECNYKEALRCAKILQMQTVNLEMQSRSLIILAQAYLRGHHINRNPALSLEYALRASRQGHDKWAQDQGFILIKQIEELKAAESATGTTSSSESQVLKKTVTLHHHDGPTSVCSGERSGTGSPSIEELKKDR